MKQNTSVVNQLTGEVYDIPETTDLAEQKNNEIVGEMFTDAVLDLYAQYEYLKEQKEMFEHKLKKVCEENGIQKVDNEYFSISFIKAHKGRKVNTDLMKKAGIYDEFTTETDVKDYVRVRIK